MTSEKQAQKFYTDDLGGTSDWLKHHPELGSGMSSERNFCSALFLNCHFVRKQVVASQNVSSFLSLVTYIKHLNDYDLH